LCLDSKGFFTVLFNNQEDKDLIFENGPYFFNSTVLYLRYWTNKFTLETKYFFSAPVYIFLYSLPQDFWDLETLTRIGNTLGSFAKSSDVNLGGKYTSYYRAFVYMDISTTLPEVICLIYARSKWIKTIDYKHIPFRCRKYHEHEHLFRD